MDWQELTDLTRGQPIVVERVRLVGNDVAIEGEFEPPQLAQLSVDDQVFVAAFVRAHGSIKEMERVFGVSYPTIKARLNRVADKLEFVDVDPAPGGAEREQPTLATAGTARPKYLRVMVDGTEGPDQEQARINIRVPLQLLRAGIRLTSLIPPVALAKANAELARSGAPVDLTELKPQHVEALIEHLDQPTVDIDQSDAEVRIFCE